jgi:hypothetical protein
MADIIRTWPANVDAHSVAKMFGPLPVWAAYYFTLGRGKPKQQIDRLWFTYRGRVLGYFNVDHLIQNDGSLPRLRSISNEESEWQVKRDHWIVVCESSCVRLKDRLFMSGFRGFRYFDIENYRQTLESKVRL